MSVPAEHKIERSATRVLTNGDKIAAQVVGHTEHVVHKKVGALENVRVYALKHILIGVAAIVKIHDIGIVYMPHGTFLDAARLSGYIKIAGNIKYLRVHFQSPLGYLTPSVSAPILATTSALSS